MTRQEESKNVKSKAAMEYVQSLAPETKQEKIRKGIRQLMDGCYNARNPDYPKLRAFQPMKFLNELIPYLHSQGVVIKVDRELPDADDNLVEDGFGTAASAVCSECGCRSVYVCRPGDIRCGVCYDNNPKEWYAGEECVECGMNAMHNNVCLCCGSKYVAVESLIREVK